MNSDDTVFWREKQAELDSDLEVQQIRRAALRLPPIMTRTEVINTEAAPIIVDGGLAVGHIALTFDDGPHPVNTLMILNTLTDHGVYCNFFQVGKQIQNHSDISRLLAQKGHVVASHSMTHSDLAQMTEDDAKREIVEGREIVAATTGVDVPFFRFPFNSTNAALRSFVQQSKLATFYSSMDSQDHEFQGKHNCDLRSLLRAALSGIDQAKSGIMILHAKRQSALILPDILNYMKVKRYAMVKFVPC